MVEEGAAAEVEEHDAVHLVGGEDLDLGGSGVRQELDEGGHGAGLVDGGGVAGLCGAFVDLEFEGADPVAVGVVEVAVTADVGVVGCAGVEAGESYGGGAEALP